MDPDVKLRKAVKEARKAFWDEIDGDTDLPSGFGIRIKGLVKTYDEDIAASKTVTAQEHSLGKELQDFMEKADKVPDESDSDE